MKCIAAALEKVWVTKGRNRSGMGYRLRGHFEPNHSKPGTRRLVRRRQCQQPPIGDTSGHLGKNRIFRIMVYVRVPQGTTGVICLNALWILVGSIFQLVPGRSLLISIIHFSRVPARFSQVLVRVCGAGPFGASPFCGLSLPDMQYFRTVRHRTESGLNLVSQLVTSHFLLGRNIFPKGEINI
jgi:hypothetical protein